MTKIDVPVLIVGGGGAGLTASMLLSKLGVESLLVSALPTTSILPKAHVLNQRCMEIFSDLGVAEEIYARGTPAENMRYSAYYAGSPVPIRCTGGSSADSSAGARAASTPIGRPPARVARPTCRRSGSNRS